jgi:signal transduction histidine kinase
LNGRRADGLDSITMVFSLVELRRNVKALRRRGAIMASAATIVIVLLALAAIGTSARHTGMARLASQSEAAAIDKAAAVLDRQRRGLGELAQLAATQSDAAVQRFLDQLPSLTPGIRAAAIVDAGGTVQLRSAASFDSTTLATLAADAAATQPGAALLVTQTGRDAGSDAVVAVARPLPTGIAGRGVALFVIDASAFAGLDLVRDDGAPLFDGAGASASVPVGDFPLRLAVRAGGSSWLAAALPFAVAAMLGVAALVIALALLLARLRSAERRIRRYAAAERELRRELSAAVAAVDRTDELHRTKSQFFAQVTHELRTPLNAILGFSETIRQELFGPVSNSRYFEYAGLIHDAGAHLLSLINDLLDNARIEAGKMEIAPIRVAASALARSALDLVELLAEGRQIAVTVAGLTSCPDLNIDPRAMKQVLVNLLSNAIKYTLPGGRVELRFAAGDDGRAAITIADTGIGMSMEDLRVAFEPFGRAGGMEARRQQGTGLGLSLARALVRLHGGELTLVSQLDFGTTATIVLPASAVFAPPAPLAKPAISEAARAA